VTIGKSRGAAALASRRDLLGRFEQIVPSAQ
jgi:hypothetical protein